MTQQSGNDKDDGPLSNKANAAFQQAATKIIERAKQTGTPVVVWEEGQVKEVPPEEASLSDKEPQER